MNELRITVRHNNSEIIYEQTIKEALSFSASAEAGYSKSDHNDTLLSTIKTMCAEVKKLDGSLPAPPEDS